jgi:hypothetical protein
MSEVVDSELTEVWLAAGPQIGELVQAQECHTLPPPPEDQLLISPKLEQGYADHAARHYYSPRYGAGYVLRLRVRQSFLDRYFVHRVRPKTPGEYWIPVGDLPELNAHLEGPIEIVTETHQGAVRDNARSVRELMALGRAKRRGPA